MKSFNLNRSNKGYTFVELMIGLTLFIVVAVIPINLLLTSNKTFDKITSQSDMQRKSVKVIYDFEQDVEKYLHSIKSVNLEINDEVFDAFAFYIDEDRDGQIDKGTDEFFNVIAYGLMKQDNNNDDKQDFIKEVDPKTEKEKKYNIYKIVRLYLTNEDNLMNYSYWKENTETVIENIVSTKIRVSNVKELFTTFEFLGNDLTLDLNKNSVIEEFEIGSYYNSNAFIDNFFDNENASLAEIDKISIIRLNLNQMKASGSKIHKYSISKDKIIK